jgi:hypothetical protein
MRSLKLLKRWESVEKHLKARPSLKFMLVGFWDESTMTDPAEHSQETVISRQEMVKFQTLEQLWRRVFNYTPIYTAS